MTALARPSIQHASSSRCSLEGANLKRRAQKLLQEEIAFIPNAEFQHPDAEAEILDSPLNEQSAAVSKAPQDLPKHLARMCETPLLSAATERQLFRLMNYLKYRANVLRSRLNEKRPNRRSVEQAETFLQRALETRNRLIEANMRLVIAVVKKFVTPQHSFDDLLSEGAATMMHAVDKFDYDRGYRFSTYSYRAISRNVCRMLNDRRKESLLEASAESLDALPDERLSAESRSLSLQQWSELRGRMQRMLEQLDPREQMIVEGRFALGDETKIKTFQSLANELGISKERVRQLQERAIGKLQALALQWRLKEFETE